MEKSGITFKKYLKIYPFVLLVVFGALIINCAPPRQVKKLPPPKFSFEPPSQAAQKLDMTIAIVNPEYSEKVFGYSQRSRGKFVEARNNAIRKFSDSMGTDMERIMVAKGFKTTGPFESLNVMTFPQKEGASLALYPEFKFTLNEDVTRENPPVDFFSGSIEGNITLSGFISLVLIEPISGEKMWVKKIELQSLEEPFAISTRGQRAEIYRDNRAEAISYLLGQYYPDVMKKLWDYIHSDEIAQLVKEAKTVRDKKRY